MVDETRGGIPRRTPAPDGASRLIVPALITLCLAVVTSAGSMLYMHDAQIRALESAFEKLRVKDYRQHRETLQRVIDARVEIVVALEGVMATTPDAFGDSGAQVLRRNKERLLDARAELAAYVQENKNLRTTGGSR